MDEWRLKVAEMVAVFWLHNAERGRGRIERECGVKGRRERGD